MTDRELVAMCVSEALERATTAYVNAADACFGEDEPLTARQKILVGSALMAAFSDMAEALSGMVRAADALGRFDAGRFDDSWTRLGDEIERWLAESEPNEGGLQ